jgi:hypothetical protein
MPAGRRQPPALEFIGSGLCHPSPREVDYRRSRPASGRTRSIAEESMSFWILLTDLDRNIFSLHGPVPDDTEWTNKALAAARMGRQVHCSTIAGTEDRQAILKRECARGLTQGHVSFGYSS